MGETFGDVVVSHGSAVTLATVAGEIDVSTAPGIQAVIDEAIETTAVGVVVIDLSGVLFMGSHGLGMLTAAAGRARERQVRLSVVTGGNRTVLRPVRITGLEQLLAFHDALSDALTDLPRDSGEDR